MESVKKPFFFLLFLVLLCIGMPSLTSKNLWAAAEDGSAIFLGIHRFRPSVRALGMGNAYSTVIDGRTAAFYNPGLLSYLPKEPQSKWSFVDMGLGYRAFVEYKKITEKFDIKDTDEKIQELNNALANELGNTFSLRASSLGFSWYKKNYAITFIPLDASLYFQPAQQVNIALHVKGYADTSLAVSQSRMVENEWGKWSIGYTSKFVYRGYMSHTLSVADLAFSDSLISNNEMSEGITLDIDMGTHYTPTRFSKGFFYFFHPSFSFVMHNTFDYGFLGDFNLWNKKSNVYNVEKLYRTFDMGFNLELQGMKYYQLNFTGEIRDMGHPQWHFSKGYNLGILISIKSFMREFYISSGWNQGRVSTGLGFTKGHITLDVATWKDETGDSKEKKSLTLWGADFSMSF